MMQATVAIFLLRCLEFKGFISKGGPAASGLSDEQLFFAKLLHHFMRCAYFNTHETVVAEESDGGGGDSAVVKARRIGRATNPTLALINHSCDPNYRVVLVVCNKPTVSTGWFVRSPLGLVDFDPLFCPNLLLQLEIRQNRHGRQATWYSQIQVNKI